MRCRVLLVAYDGADGLDLFGPAEVFAAADRRLAREAYDVIVVAVGGDSITVTSGAGVDARELESLRPQGSDIVLVAGGSDPAIEVAASDAVLMRWLVRAARIVRRIG